MTYCPSKVWIRGSVYDLQHLDGNMSTISTYNSVLLSLRAIFLCRMTVDKLNTYSNLQK